MNHGYNTRWPILREDYEGDELIKMQRREKCKYYGKVFCKTFIVCVCFIGLFTLYFIWDLNTRTKSNITD